MSKYTIGITCTTVFHYVHFHRIEEQLKAKGYEVIYIVYTPYFTQERVNRLEKVFQENGIEYCGFEELFVGTRKFDLLFSPYYMPGFQLVDKKIKKARLLYGYAKDRWNYAEWNAGFDLILSYGEYATKHLQTYAHTVNIGHPRQREQYRAEVKDLAGKVVNRSSLAGQQTVVYCPTWADLSSLQQFVDNVEELISDFNVIVKLHHGNVLAQDHHLWSKLYKIPNVYLFDEYTDLFDLLQFADGVVSDYSGAIFDAMLFKVPIVLLDILDDSIVDTGKVNLNKMQDVSKYSNELEFVSLDIKIRDMMPHIRDLRQLSAVLKEEIGDNRVPYLELLQQLYSEQDDRAPERAAAALEALMLGEKLMLDVDKQFHLIDEQKLDRFVDQIDKQSLHIWGAGLTGQILYAHLKNRNVSLGRLMDMDSNKHGECYLDATIVAPVLEGKILIAVPGDANAKIKHSLAQKGLIEGKDFISAFK